MKQTLAVAAALLAGFVIGLRLQRHKTADLQAATAELHEQIRRLSRETTELTKARATTDIELEKLRGQLVDLKSQTGTAPRPTSRPSVSAAGTSVTPTPIEPPKT